MRRRHAGVLRSPSRTQEPGDPRDGGQTATARRALGVGTGDRLEVEFADSAVVLRLARRADAAGEAVPKPAVVVEQPLEAEPEPVQAAAPPPAVKRGSGPAAEGAGRRRPAAE